MKLTRLGLVAVGGFAGGVGLCVLLVAVAVQRINECLERDQIGH